MGCRGLFEQFRFRGLERGTFFAVSRILVYRVGEWSETTRYIFCSDMYPHRVSLHVR